MNRTAAFLVLCLAAMSCKGKRVGPPRESSIGGQQAVDGGGHAGTSTMPRIIGGSSSAGTSGEASSSGQQQIPDAGRDSGSGGATAPVEQGGVGGLPDSAGGTSGSSGARAQSDGGTSNGGTSNGGTSNGGTSNGGTSNGGTSNGGATIAGAGGNTNHLGLAGGVAGTILRSCTLGDFVLNECSLR